MLPNQSYSRIDTSELKFTIVQKIGHQRAEKYFDLTRRLFGLKISKCDFNKFCIRTIGRENVHLHNKLIRSIIKNACLARTPPLTGIRKTGGALNAKVAIGYQKSCAQPVYGDAFPQCPRKGRSAVNRDRKCRDRPSPLGPNGKPQNIAYEELISKAHEQQSPTELLSLDSRPPIEVASEDGEEVEQVAGSPAIQSRSPVTAPFGISMYLGGSRKAFPNVSVCGGTYHRETCQNCGELPDTKSLRSRLERKLEMEGIGVSVDSVNLLNNGLDTFLKRLLEPCIRLAGTRHGDEHLKQLNGLYICGSNGTLRGGHMQRETKSTFASMLDFCAAVELNPQILGENWAIQLEKIVLLKSEKKPCIRTFSS
ncbi:uncharacterized protein LOC110772627 [Prunus avium]|uniref:Uncharacterized protein LOC110772627 n=1 Tax=Prunus avium TaxID=42229 RepID=A0A6P5U008_PRUAV|nr:uncharacterized protein LOC110772627 [Prunus avium]